MDLLSLRRGLEARWGRPPGVPDSFGDTTTVNARAARAQEYMYPFWSKPVRIHEARTALHSVAIESRTVRMDISHSIRASC